MEDVSRTPSHSTHPHPRLGRAAATLVLLLALGVASGATCSGRSDVVVVVNGESPISVAIGEYYRAARGLYGNTRKHITMTTTVNAPVLVLAAFPVLFRVTLLSLILQSVPWRPLSITEATQFF